MKKISYMKVALNICGLATALWIPNAMGAPQNVWMQIQAGSANAAVNASSDGDLPPANKATPPYPDRDDDGDGLTNAEEMKLGSDPLLADADADGLNDREESMRGSDPTEADTDHDGVPDGQDGWPRHPWITQAPLPRTQYALVRLRELGFPQEALFYSYGQAELNDQNDVVAYLPGTGHLMYWNGTAHTATELQMTPSNQWYGWGWGWNYGSAIWGGSYYYGYGYWARHLAGGGQVIGQIQDNHGYVHAAKWAAATGVTSLDSGDLYSTPIAVNNSGEVVGIRSVYEGISNGQNRKFGGVAWGGGEWLGGGYHLYQYRPSPYSETVAGAAFFPRSINNEGIVGGIHETLDLSWDRDEIDWIGTANPQAALIDGGNVRELGSGIVWHVTSGQNPVALGTEPSSSGAYWGIPWWAHKEQGNWVREPLRDIWSPSTMSLSAPNSFYSYYNQINDRLEMIYSYNTLIRNGVFETVAVPAGWFLQGLYDINNRGTLLGNARRILDAAEQAIPSNEQVMEPILAVPASLLVDANHDGAITDLDVNLNSQTNPFRFWVNDDDDSPNESGVKQPDWESERVDGVGDLKDFFPVVLDIKNLLGVLPPSESIKYKLVQADGALNFVYTHLGVNHPFEYLNELNYSGYGPQLNSFPQSALVQQIGGLGVDLFASATPEFRSSIEEEGKGVILVEIRRYTTAPLKLVVEKNGVQVAEMKLYIDPDWSQVKRADRDDPDKSWVNAENFRGPVYAGDESGDMVSWSMREGTPQAVNYQWTATDGDGRVIQGPSGPDLRSWKIANGGNDAVSEWLDWRPGDYSISVQLSFANGTSKILTTKQKVGWRTGDWLVVGQVVPVTDLTIDSGAEASLRNALVNELFDNGLQPLVGPQPEDYAADSTRLLGFMWLGYHGTFDVNPVQANLFDPFTSPPTTIPMHSKHWLLQDALSANPDLFQLTEELSDVEAFGLKQSKQFRMFTRYYFRFTLSSVGTIENVQNIKTPDCVNGPTKFTPPAPDLPFLRPLVRRLFEFGLLAADTASKLDSFSNTNQVFIQSDPSPYNGLYIGPWTLSTYNSERLGLEGRRPGFALIGHDAPFIYTEISTKITNEGDLEDAIRFSIDKYYMFPSGDAGGIHHFNEITIYKYQKTPTSSGYRRMRFYPIKDQLVPFLDSGSTSWPGTPPEPPNSSLNFIPISSD